MRSEVVSLAWAALACGAAAQDVLWDQQPDSSGLAFLSMNIVDDTTTSTYLFDDIIAPVPWTISRVIVYGDEGGVASSTIGMHMRFCQRASYTSPGLIGATWDVVGYAGLSSGLLTFTLPSSFILLAGNWFLSAWLDRNYGPPEWAWKARLQVAGNEAIAHNPGGGLLGTTSPGTISSFTAGPPVDLAFRIEGVAVPEPATGILVGFAAMALWRRRCAMK